MSGESRLDTPMNRVIGLGSAKDGVGHWWAQRLSSIALAPLVGASLTVHPDPVPLRDPPP